ncbi:hypothetical protein VDGE_30395 [Verticillium dahliae]|uniref:Uncharacterized protein n=1 Tax=Verticillium dahliae TaxID=27337 RepID=A0A444RQL1_VERDA|nr:hypothetical protein VDGE_30395 [Verticillium dahliae]
MQPLSSVRARGLLGSNSIRGAGKLNIAETLSLLLSVSVGLWPSACRPIGRSDRSHVHSPTLEGWAQPTDAITTLSPYSDTMPPLAALQSWKWVNGH